MKHKKCDQITDDSKRSFWTRLQFAALACVMVFCASGCTITAPEYSQKLATARTNCTGREIVGVWVSRMSVPLSEMRSTLLLRPDGTGRMRLWTDSSSTDYDSTWRYVGDGRWQGRAKSRTDYSDFTMTIRYTGNEILMEGIGSFNLTWRDVFVRADNEAVVDDHLKKR